MKKWWSLWVLVALVINQLGPNDCLGETEISTLSPYYMTHEVGFQAVPNMLGSLPRGFEKTLSYQTGSGNGYRISNVLCGKRSASLGLQEGDELLKLSNCSKRKLQQVSYLELLAAFMAGKDQQIPVRVHRMLTDANNRGKAVPLDFDLNVEIECKSRLGETHENYVHDLLIHARRAMISGDWEYGSRMLRNAVMHMEEVEVAQEKSKRRKAMVGAESERYFRGDIYEVAMANYYLGLVYFSKGDYETAMVGFRRSLQNDQESRKPEHQDDFGCTHYMMGCTYRILNQMDNAGVAFRKTFGGDYKFDTKDKANVLIIVEIGRAPFKVALGLEGERDQVVKPNYPEASVEILMDGVSQGKATMIMDVFEQANTTGRTTKDAVQTGKMVAKTGLRVAASVFIGQAGDDLVAKAWDVRADTRCWDNLPCEIHALQFQAEPGLHNVTLVFRNKNEVELRRYEQSWYYLPVDKEKNNVFLFQSGRDRCNISAPLELTRVLKFKASTIQFTASDIAGLEVDEELDVVRLKSPIVDEAGELLDFETETIAKVKVTEIKGVKATGQLTDLGAGVGTNMYVTRGPKGNEYQAVKGAKAKGCI